MNTKVGKVYKIVCNEVDKVYIGSTGQTLQKRMVMHMNSMNRWINGKMHFLSSFEILQYPSARIELISEHDIEYTDDKDFKTKLRVLENIEMLKWDNRVNRNRAFTTKEEKLEYIKKFQENNKEKHNAAMKKWRNKKHNCECGGKYTPDRKAAHLKTKKHLSFLSTKKQLSQI